MVELQNLSEEGDWPPKPTSMLLYVRRRGETEWTPIFPAQLYGLSNYSYEFKAEEIGGPEQGSP